MNYGLYLSAGGALSSLHRQDVIANNLANVNTIAFKPAEVAIRSRLPERAESELAIDPQALLEQLGGGQFSHPTRMNLAQAELTQTGNALDVALQGEGFFVVHDGRGALSDASRLALTRDGRFSLNATGELIMVTTGMRVLDENDQPIHLNRTGEVRIDSTGRVMQSGVQVANLQVVKTRDAAGLIRQGGNLLRMGDGASAREPADAAVRQGHLEGSGVDPVLTLNALIDAAKSVQANATMIQYHDHVLEQAINTFARVA